MIIALEAVFTIVYNLICNELTIKVSYLISDNEVRINELLLQTKNQGFY